MSVERDSVNVVLLDGENCVRTLSSTKTHIKMNCAYPHHTLDMHNHYGDSRNHPTGIGPELMEIKSQVQGTAHHLNGLEVYKN